MRLSGPFVQREHVCRSHWTHNKRFVMWNCVAIATVRDVLTFQRQATVADGVDRGRLCGAVNVGGR